MARRASYEFFYIGDAVFGSNRRDIVNRALTAVVSLLDEFWQGIATSILPAGRMSRRNGGLSGKLLAPGEESMKTSLSTLTGLVFVLTAACTGQTGTAEADKEARNKEIVVAFYNAAINDKDFAKASQYLGDVYIQHNPLAADGPEGLKSFLEFAKANMSDFKIEIKRVLADGNFVMVHVHATRGPEDRGSAVMDIFRLTDDGKVVEHWDVLQEIPEQAMNDNGMF